MRKFILVLALITLFFAIFACSKEPQKKLERIDNIERVFMHEPSKYTFWIRNDASGEIKIKTVDVGSGGNVKIFDDVPAGQKMWITILMVDEPYDGMDFIPTLEIHLHDLKDVQGAGWDHGKLGNGTTEVIE